MRRRTGMTRPSSTWRYGLPLAAILLAIGVLLANLMRDQAQQRAADSARQAAEVVVELAIKPQIDAEQFQRPLDSVQARLLEYALRSMMRSGRIGDVRLWSPAGQPIFSPSGSPGTPEPGEPAMLARALRGHPTVVLRDPAGSTRHMAALLLLDLDRFKEVNDTLGHHYGDQLLVQVGQRLPAALRNVDTVARLGGDEFAVLLPRIETAEGAVTVAKKLLAAFEEPFLLEGLTLDVEASIGVAIYPEHANDSEELLQRADIAMYVAKDTHAGFVLFDTRQDQHSPRRLALLGELRRAIEHEQLLLHYQPKVDAHTSQVLGVEALVRWQHPEHGLIPPGACWISPSPTRSPPRSQPGRCPRDCWWSRSPRAPSWPTQRTRLRCLAG
jgi:diguanylate cyclase (GGDEF)-like protein